MMLQQRSSALICPGADADEMLLELLQWSFCTKGGDFMSECLTAYYVHYFEIKSSANLEELDSLGELKVGYWSSHLLATRLLSLKYSISSAELVVLDNVTKHLVED